MKFYKYFNSPDVVQYYTQNNIQLNGLETAFVIWLNKSITIEQKHLAYEEIIKTMPDMIVSKSPQMKLHNMLRKYTNIEKMLLGIFYKNKECKDYYDWNDSFDSEIFSFEEILQHFSENTEKKIVGKDVLLSGTDNYTRIYVEVNREGEAIRVLCDGEELLTTNQKKIYNYFRYAYIEIPMPFKKGDLLCLKYDQYDETLSFVFEDIYYEVENNYLWCLADHSEDALDGVSNENLRIEGYRINDNGEVYFDSMIPHSFDMMYCRKGLTWEEEFLKKFGKCMSGEGLDGSQIMKMLNDYDKLREKLKS